jgi:hypothetical protein
VVPAPGIDFGVQQRTGVCYRPVKSDERGDTVKSVITALLLLTVLVACSAKQATRAPERATAKEPYNVESEGKIPPPEEKAPEVEADVEEIPVDEADIVGQDVPAPRDTTKAARGGPTGVEGRDGSVNVMVYRVQVLATTSEQSALETEKKIESRLGIAAYVNFEDGMYKVRVGDGATRQEAEKVRAKVRAAGYSDAWIVRDSYRAGPASEGTSN